MEYKTFKVGDLFDCTKAKYTQPKELIDGDIPYVSRSAENNGVIQYCGNGIVSKGQCITIGGEGRYAFYQDADFVSGSNITVLRNVNLNPMRALYLCSILNSYVDDYSYQNVRTLSRVQAEEIQLPVTASGEPDWQYMEDYMKCIMEEVEHVLDELNTDLASPEPLSTNFGTFTYTAFFKKASSQKYLLKNQLTAGNIPVYSATTENCGIESYCGNKPEFIVDEQHPFYIVFGDHTHSINIATESFCIMNTAKVLVLIDNHITELIAKYICTAWEKAIPNLGYSRHWSKAEAAEFQLPIDSQGNPDWTYMEQYMQQIMTDMLPQNITK